jgi:hypothetical protein
VFPPFSFQDVIQTALQDVCLTPSRGKNGMRLACRAGVTRETFWAAKAEKMGSLPPVFVFFPPSLLLAPVFLFPEVRRASNLSAVKNASIASLQSASFTLCTRLS